MPRCEQCGEDAEVNREIRDWIRNMLRLLPLLFGWFEEAIAAGDEGSPAMVQAVAKGRGELTWISEQLDRADAT